MPNHVYSVLKFSYHDDKGEMIENIIESIGDLKNPLDFNKIIPQPLGIQDEREEVLSDAERNWNIENWGTKWNAYDVSIKSKDTWKLVVGFQTAWNAPNPVINKIMELFPLVDINYLSADDGGWFACHIEKSQSEGVVSRIWDRGNDADGVIRSALFEALNSSY